MQHVRSRSNFGTATRRFYGVFYQWTTLTSSTRLHRNHSWASFPNRQNSIRLLASGEDRPIRNDHVTHRPFTTEAVKRSNEIQLVRASDLDTGVSSQDSELLAEETPQFPPALFRSLGSHRIFRQLRRIGASLELETASQSLARRSSLEDYSHYLTTVDADFAAYWTHDVAAARVKEIERDAGCQIKFVNGPYKFESYLTVTGLLASQRNAIDQLTKEYVKAPLESYCTTENTHQWVELRYQLPVRAFLVVVGRCARGLAQYRRMDSCSVTTDMDSVQDDKWTVQIRGPKDAAEYVRRHMDVLAHVPDNQSQRSFKAQAGAIDKRKQLPTDQKNQNEVRASSANELQSFSSNEISSLSANEIQASSANEKSETSLSARMRQLMRQMPHPVVLVTASKSDSFRTERNNTDLFNRTDTKNFCAMTVSSMTTVSLDPDPVISFNVKKPSQTLDAIQSQKSFFINLLINSPQGAHLAHQFSQGDAQAAFQKIQERGARIQLRPSLFSFTPVISSPGINGHLACTVIPDQCVTVSDHVIVVAKVHHISTRRAGRKSGLAYGEGSYRQRGTAHSLQEIEQATFENVSQSEKAEKTVEEGPNVIRRVPVGDRDSKSPEFPLARLERRLGLNAVAPRTIEFPRATQPLKPDQFGETKHQPLRSDANSISQSLEATIAAEDDDFESDVPREARYNFPNVDSGDDLDVGDFGHRTSGQESEGRSADSVETKDFESIPARPAANIPNSDGDPLARQRSWPVMPR